MKILKTYNQHIKEDYKQVATMLDMDPGEFEDSNDLMDLADDISLEDETADSYSADIKGLAEYIMSDYSENNPNLFGKNLTRPLFDDENDPVTMITHQLIEFFDHNKDYYYYNDDVISYTDYDTVKADLETEFQRVVKAKIETLLK